MDWIFFSLSLFSLLMQLNAASDQASIVGVNYGLLGNNLPPPTQVISLLQSRNISRVRLFNPDHGVLSSLQNSGIELILRTLNEDLQDFESSNIPFAKNWVENNMVPFADKIKFHCIAAGNEVIPSDLAVHVFPALANLSAALKASNLGEIAVSTSVATAVLGNSYPPSQGVFSEAVTPAMQQITRFLVEKDFPLLVNVYPYFSYVDNPLKISRSFALFNTSEVVVKDGNLGYKNLFDATVDAVYSALEKLGGNSVELRERMAI